MQLLCFHFELSFLADLEVHKDLTSRNILTQDNLDKFHILQCCEPLPQAILHLWCLSVLGKDQWAKLCSPRNAEFRIKEVIVLVYRRRRNLVKHSPGRSLFLFSAISMKQRMERKAGSVSSQVLGSHTLLVDFSAPEKCRRFSRLSGLYSHTHQGWCVCSQAQLSLALSTFLSTLKHFLTLKPDEYLPMWAALLSRIL